MYIFDTQFPRANLQNLQILILQTLKLVVLRYVDELYSLVISGPAV